MKLKDFFEKKKYEGHPDEKTPSSKALQTPADHEDKEKDINSEAPGYDEVEIMRTRLVQSQMGPHFMFNVLNTIYYLCEKDPQEAQKAILDFSTYLRNNMDFIRVEEPIPLRDELSLVRSYLELEKLRYGDELIVIYNIDTDDFRLPAFSVQAIVENAVRHGIGKKDEGGTIEISAYEGQDSFCVDVFDDGSGFDENAGKDEARSHTGIENVRYLLRYMCDGTLTYVTDNVSGTHALIRIPKNP